MHGQSNSSILRCLYTVHGKTATMIVNVKDPRDTKAGDLVTYHTPEKDPHHVEDDHPPDMTTEGDGLLKSNNHQDKILVGPLGHFLIRYQIQRPMILYGHLVESYQTRLL